jgi:hypothetical protein
MEDYLVGAFHIGVDPTSVVVNSGCNYSIEKARQEETRSIYISGNIDIDRFTSELLLSGERSLHGLPITMIIRIGQPTQWEEPVKHQTKLLPDSPELDIIRTSIGQLIFMPAGDVITEYCLQADIDVAPALFDDLWSWIKLSQFPLHHLWLWVYGEDMEQVESNSHITYHWRQQARLDAFLNIASFNFSAMRELKSIPRAQGQ